MSDIAAGEKDPDAVDRVDPDDAAEARVGRKVSTELVPDGPLLGRPAAGGSFRLTVGPMKPDLVALEPNLLDVAVAGREALDEGAARLRRELVDQARLAEARRQLSEPLDCASCIDLMTYGDPIFVLAGVTPRCPKWMSTASLALMGTEIEWASR